MLKSEGVAGLKLFDSIICSLLLPSNRARFSWPPLRSVTNVLNTPAQSSKLLTHFCNSMIVTGIEKSLQKSERRRVGRVGRMRCAAAGRPVAQYTSEASGKHVRFPWALAYTTNAGFRSTQPNREIAGSRHLLSRVRSPSLEYC